MRGAGGVLLGVAALVCAGLVLTGSPASQGESPLEVPRLESAEAQAAHARRARSALRGLGNEERVRAREVAVEACLAVELHWPGSRPLAAEAVFRAGELLRAGGDDARARAAFSRACELGAGTPFRARSELELGHLERRAGNSRAALDRYTAVAADASAPRRIRDDAALWAGRVWLESGNEEEAQRIWTRVARGAQDPLDRVHAYDELALLRVERGDLEGAAGLLQQCRESLADVALEETQLGERLRNALVRMRALVRLRAAIEARRAREARSRDG